MEKVVKTLLVNHDGTAVTHEVTGMPGEIKVKDASGDFTRRYLFVGEAYLQKKKNCPTTFIYAERVNNG